MGGIDNGWAFFVEPFDTFQDEIPTLGIHSDSRFIQENQFGSMSDAAGDIEAAIEAVRAKSLWLKNLGSFPVIEADYKK